MMSPGGVGGGPHCKPPVFVGGAVGVDRTI